MFICKKKRNLQLYSIAKLTIDKECAACFIYKKGYKHIIHVFPVIILNERVCDILGLCLRTNASESESASVQLIKT